MKISIVTTLYCSENYILEFYEKATSTASRLFGDDFELIFVNDGSPDASLTKAVDISKRDPRVLVLDLSRNFGHHKAIMTGLQQSQGELVFLIDSDLEEDPTWLKLFFNSMQNDEKIDVVYGMQANRKGGTFEKASGSFFWTMINLLSGLNLTPNLVTARLMNRKYVDALVLHKEREVFLAGLWHITGFNQVGIEVKKLSRDSTTYTFSRKVSLFVNSITSFSSLPLAAIFYCGICIIGITSVYIVYLFLNWMIFSHVVIGWTSLMASLWLIGGLVLSSLGIIGIYLSKIFMEVKKRPYTIVKKVYGRKV